MRLKLLIIFLAVVILFGLNLFIGSISIPVSEVLAIITGRGAGDTLEFIVLESRLPMALTAMMSGASLACCGLVLQTAFRNPLAGPSILGVSSGASLGVAVVILFFGGSLSAGSISTGGQTALLCGAFAGSMFITGVLLTLSAALRSDLMLLVTGIMISYLVSSGIMLLNFNASSEGIQSYVMWGMSSFGSVSLRQFPLFAMVCFIGLILAVVLIKQLNLLILGDRYARNLGVDLKRVRNLMLLSTGVLTAAVTAYCGPVSFIGLAVPHIARLILHSEDQRYLMPATIMSGAAIALGCNLLCVLPESTILPVNAVTPLFGAPVVLWIILRKRRSQM